MESSLFKNKDFVIFLFGKFISYLGTEIMQFAIALYILEKTGSTAQFATLLSLAIIPRILLAPIAGVCGDWFDRKKAIILLDAINGITLIVLFLLFITTSELTSIHAMIIVMFLEITQIFYGASTSAVIPSMIKKEQLMDANRYISTCVNGCMLLGPVIGSIFYTTFGILSLLIINGISFIVAAICESFIRIPKTHVKPKEININAFIKDFKIGCEAMVANKSIQNTILIAVVINFLVSPTFSIGLIHTVKNVLNESNLGYSLIQTTLAISMLIAPLLAPRIIGKKTPNQMIVISSTITAVVLIIIGLVVSDYSLSLIGDSRLPLVLVILCSGIIGVILSVSNICLSTQFQSIVPKDKMGRIGTFMSTSMTISIPLGQIVIGFLFEYTSAMISFGIIGVLLAISINFFNKKIQSNEALESRIAS